MATFSAEEQLMLELINRARLDPGAEATRFGITLNKGIAAGSISSAAKQPLAPNSELNDSARAHSQWMLDEDIFSHTGIGGSNPGQRMVTAGYAAAGTFGWGENIAMRGTTGVVNAASFITAEHRDLFLSTSGHRENLLDPVFREIGVGGVLGSFTNSSGTFNTLMTTQNFGDRNDTPFVTGVAYNDTVVKDNFYSVGEGRQGITVTVAQSINHVTTTQSAGGYAVTAQSGAANVTFSGGGLANDVTVGISIGALNVKVDLVNSITVQSSTSTTLKDGAKNLKLLGVGTINGTGNAEANILAGGPGKNKLVGGSGNDTLIGGKGADILNGGAGRDMFDFNSLSDSGLTSATRDVIQAFQRGLDDIDLRSIDAKTGVAGNQAFKFIGFQDFHDRKGELRIVDVGKNLRVEGDVNGDGRADFQISVLGLGKLGAGDFLL